MNVSFLDEITASVAPQLRPPPPSAPAQPLYDYNIGFQQPCIPLVKLFDDSVIEGRESINVLSAFAVLALRAYKKSDLNSE